MCGICGVFNKDTTRPADGGAIRRMADTLSLRGPDSSGVLTRGNMGVGHTRLSIIDLNTGDQPMSNETGDVHIVFNGEIYNFQEKAELLTGKGHTLKTRSDTEVILHLYEEFGPDCVDHLRGMFAFAILDERRRRLFIARDRLGVKPVYYHDDGGKFLFGSELKAITAHPDVRREIDPAALDYFLTFLYIPAPLSIYKDARKLPPGHWMTVDANGIDIRRYWRPEPAENPVTDERAALEELEALIDESVRIRLISDVPLGAFLSGGIDSSLVVAAMSKWAKPVRTFSIGFGDRRYTELPKARIVAERFGAEHREFIVEPKPEEVVPIMSYFDEPFADSSAIPTWHVSRLAREHVKTVLSGDGGDETFLGYRKYWSARTMQAFQSIPAPLRRGLIPALARALPDPKSTINLLSRIRFFVEKAAAPGEEQYLTSHSFITPDAKKELYTSHWDGAKFDRAEFFREFFTHSKSDPLVVGYNQTDFRMYLPDDIMVKVDRMSMANSLEAREPLLDHKLVEFAMRLSPALKMKEAGAGGGKYLLRRVAMKTLPAEIFNQKKQGFQVPLRRWLAGELRSEVEERLSPAELAAHGLFRPEYVQKILPWNRREQDRRYDTASDVWALLCFQIWFRERHMKASQP